MFDRARLKLTMWYLLIIMAISVSFSFFIYQLLQNEIKRLALVQMQRIENNYNSNTLQGPPGLHAQMIPLGFDQQILDDSRRRLVTVLMIVNGTILIISGVLGYLLAGETLKPIQDMVEDQNRFISDASHELRTPLTALKSTLEVHLRDKKLTIAEARTLIGESIEEVDKLHKLSEDLLQLVRSKHTTQTAYFKPVRLDQILSQAVKQVKAMAAKKDIKIALKASRLTVEAEAESLQQMFVIALDNAIKYSSSKSTIEVITNPQPDMVAISVIDHGVGISPKDISHIFDRFYRTDSARTRSKAGGYGLGLSIAQQIIIAHHGRIEVESQLDNGTTVTFLLPRSQTRTS